MTIDQTTTANDAQAVPAIVDRIGELLGPQWQPSGSTERTSAPFQHTWLCEHPGETAWPTAVMIDEPDAEQWNRRHDAAPDGVVRLSHQRAQRCLGVDVDAITDLIANDAVAPLRTTWWLHCSPRLRLTGTAAGTGIAHVAAAFDRLVAADDGPVSALGGEQ